MASVMTYSSLVENIQSYLERTDQATLDKIPTFIMLAEQVMAADLKFLGNLTVATSNMVQGENIIDKPARWRKTVSMNVTVNGVRQPIFLRKYEYLREYWPDPSQQDVPFFYCDYDYTHWMIAPTPNDDYAYEVLYYERVQPLDATNQSNWFTEYAPQALLYGSLLQAMPFLKNDERIPMWQAQYEQIMNVLKTEDVARIGDRQAIARDI
ncbi:MAG: hypothetical protein EBU08_05950 [Micrococcales bacterium]|nr:hypothetical protein [Micrococcales bacterium]